MVSFKFSFAAILALLPTCLYAYPNPLPFTGDITSPLGSSPTMCKLGTTYFIFTGGVGIPIYTSTDLVAWTNVGVVFPTGAPWTAPYTGGDNLKLWAPDCKVVDGAFRLFYAASTLGSQNSAIFYAYSTTGASGTWTNGGLVLSSSAADDFNAIDPNLSVDPVSYLSFGSYWSGIKGVQLDPTSYLPLSATYDSLAFRNNGVEPMGAPNSEEAPVIWHFGDFWYLFTSWNADAAYYQVHVARSSTYNSGYVGEAGLAALDNGGTVILPAHDLILGPGGQDIFVDTDGTPYIVYHYKVGTALTHHIGLNQLNMSTGWPVVI
ncbi:arabinanase [Mycena galopus ATCC 62051]|nr:arabinanase [Mycena galopus ATCC 62051]KAF8201258.1 arabinanase [Mycena galopus ATCC 62051]